MDATTNNPVFLAYQEQAIKFRERTKLDAVNSSEVFRQSQEYRNYRARVRQILNSKP